MRRRIDRRTLLSSERGLRAKRKARFSMVLCYPNKYEVAMSNLGFLTVYRMANELPHLRCERATYWPLDGETIDAGKGIGKFDIIGLSLSYELDYPRAIDMIGTSGVPLLRERRSESHPIVVAGGPAVTLNPVPLAPFVDVFFLGEAEESFPEFANLLAVIGCLKKSGWRKELLERASRIDGVYVPELTDSPKRRWVSRPERFSTCSPVLTPRSHFSNMYLVEVERGCPRGCRFCAATYLYRPFRLKSGASIIEHTQKQDLEFSRIGLVGAAVSDHPAIERLCMEFVKQGKEVAISSLRPDNVTENLLSTLVQGGLKSMTMAPETGSERLREVIGKPIQTDRILQSVEMCDRVGLRSLRLYFMVGLPFETDSDMQATAELAREIAGRFRRKISLRLSTFVPKANTPFQWEPLVASDVVKKRVEAIKKLLSSRSNIEVASRNPREVEMQAIFSRGDADVGAALHNWYTSGNWKRAFKDAGVDREALLYERFLTKERLPWDFIDMSFPKSLLRSELSRAKRAAC